MPRTSFAQEATCVIISLEGSGSVTRGDSGVRFSIKKGDSFFVGDRVNLSYGGKLQLSFDEAGLDLMEFVGPCTLKLVTSNQIELSNGEATLLLDNRRNFRKFEIVTPSGTAEARNAHLQVEVKQQSSEVRSYKSHVTVYGVDAGGEEVYPGVRVDAGKKAAVKEPGAAPSVPESLDSSDMDKMDVVKKSTNRSADWATKQDNWLGERFKVEPQDVLKGGPKKEDPDATKYVF